jgi:hypothetical protein
MHMKGMTGTDLDPVLPLACPPVSQENEGTNSILHARVAAKLRLDLTLKKCSFDNVPVLLLERLARAAGDLSAERHSFGCTGRRQVGTRKFAGEQRRIEDVRACMLDWWKRGRLLRNLCKNMQIEGSLG